MNMKGLRGLCGWVASLLFVGLAVAEVPPSTELGLPVGERAPAFTLKDQAGKDLSLDSLLKKGPIALVFFRSADWCLACDVQLAQLQHNLKQIEATGGTVVGISYDTAKTLKCFADKQKITIPILSDPDSKIIDAYGVRDRNPPRTKDGTAAHITIVLDQNGVIRAKLARVIYNGFDLEALVKALKDAQTMKGETTP
jgi:peroxiredoxin